MSDPEGDRVQEYIDSLNARRGRAPDEDGDDEEEKSHTDRLRESILEDGGDGGE